jgi:hypothetical protein
MDMNNGKKEKDSDKIKIISSECQYLLSDDLDFLIRMISVMREEYVKKDMNKK